MKLSQYSDAQLVQAYSEGQEQALEVLICRYKDKIYTSIYMLVKDKYMAEDIFQDTFLKTTSGVADSKYLLLYQMVRTYPTFLGLATLMQMELKSVRYTRVFA